ncbi:uncharacterized protein [Anabrus simplex]|uniref:uncharacterized protein n=1 Tax=Anabrus simplex TaxID=316456 RepID=UPI0035A3A8CB
MGDITEESLNNEKEPENVADVPQTPKSRKFSMRTLTRTLSTDPSIRSSGSWYEGTVPILTTSSHEEDPPPNFGPNLFTFPFYMKLAEWGMCLLCTGLHSEGTGKVTSFSYRIFPYVTAWTYMIITGIIILSYLLGQKMREVLIRIYFTLGAIMFLVTGCILVIIVSSKVEEWEMTDQDCILLTVEAVASFVNCGFYVADVAYSIYQSYHSVALEL